MNAVPGNIGVSTNSQSESTQLPAHAGSVTLSAIWIAGTLAAIALVLIGLAVVGQVARWEYSSTSQLIGIFDLDAEKNIPALFSGFIILLAGAITWLCFSHETMPAIRTKWKVLSLGIMLMAMDEVFTLHERPMDSIRGMLGGGDLGIFTFAWVVPALIILPLIAWYFLSFLRALPIETARGFILAGVLYVGGAVGMEMVGGKYFGSYGSDLSQSMIAIVEESCEMLGICYFIFVALSHLARHTKGTMLRHRA